MIACKSHQRQIALLSVQALSENEQAAVQDHLRECAACRSYAQRLEVVVGLYTADAERPLTSIPAHMRGLETQPVQWFRRLFASPAPAMAALAALLVCACLVLVKNRPAGAPAPAGQMAVTDAPAMPTVPTIGSSRHLTFQELDEIAEPEPAGTSRPVEFVFSVRTRDIGN
jgi:predicted anti-sigma-YlaC factor YlaD